MPMKKYKISVLDDYQNVALESADWSGLRERADIAVFQDHLADPDAVIERLLPFDVVCVMRERSPLPNVLVRLGPAAHCRIGRRFRQRHFAQSLRHPAEPHEPSVLSPGP